MARRKAGAEPVEKTDAIQKEKKPKRKYTRSEKTLAQRNKNIPPAICKSPEEIEYNARLIEYSLKIQQIAGQTDRKDPVSVRSAIAAYFELSSAYGFKISNLSACAAIGIDRKTLYDWRNGARQEFREIANMVLSVCCLSREQLIADGKLNPVIGIFWQRNFDGLRNDTEQQQNIETDSDSETLTASEYKAKYAGMLSEL